jgi:hypothetical protein
VNRAFAIGLGALGLIFYLSGNVWSQTNDTANPKRFVPSLSLSYNGSIIYPGAGIGVELPVKSTHIDRVTSSVHARNLYRDRLFVSHLSWYHHPGFQDNLYWTAGWLMRRTWSSGRFVEFDPEIGISRTFLGATTYQVSDQGQVSRERAAGYWYGLIAPGIGTGYNLFLRKMLPIKLFCRFNLLMLFPYNSTVYLRPVISAGWIINLSVFPGLRKGKIKSN